MNNIRRLDAKLNLDNIPHMLRNLANEYESGIEREPRFLMLIAVHDPNFPPEIFQFGKEPTRLEEIGALFACLRLASDQEPST